MTVKIFAGQETVSVNLTEPMKISQALDLAGQHMDLPCAGNGRCGKCKVKALGSLSPLSPEEKKLLTEEEIQSGTRLSCQAVVTGDAEITLPSRSEIADIQTDAVSREFERDEAEGVSVAVDIGTTTVAASLIDLSNGRELATACAQNPQEKFGADVISRIERSLAGDRQELSDCILSCLDSLIAELCKKSGVSGGDIPKIVITGNTTMLFLLTNQDVDSLSHAPFEAADLFGRDEPLHFAAAPNAACYLTRCNSAFVGGDITHRRFGQRHRGGRENRAVDRRGHQRGNRPGPPRENVVQLHRRRPCSGRRRHLHGHARFGRRSPAGLAGRKRREGGNCGEPAGCGHLRLRRD